MDGTMGCYNEKSNSNKNKEGSHEEIINSSSEELSFKNLSKIVVPPLGVSGYSSNNVCKGRIISPINGYKIPVLGDIDGSNGGVLGMGVSLRDCISKLESNPTTLHS